MIQYFVYSLCTITSALCAGALITQYIRSGTRILLWSGLCFTGFALDNLLLVIDYAVGVQIDLSIPRTIPAVLGLFVMVLAFAWEEI